MMTYQCDVLVVDDAVTSGALPSVPRNASVTVVNDISGALRRLGLDHNCQKEVPVSQIEHSFDIVLLDFRLRDEDMKEYPMGGLTLHSLVKASFTRSKRGQCIVCCYSDKMASEFPKTRYVFDLAERKLRNQDGEAGLHQSGIGGIDWSSLYLAKASSILSVAPYEVLAEIAELSANILSKAPWDKPLRQLARFLGVKECSLNQLLLRSGPPDSRLSKWLQQWLWRKSLSVSTKAVYIALYKFVHLAQGSEGRRLDRPIHRLHQDGESAHLPYVVDDKGVQCCMPDALATELENLADQQSSVISYDNVAAARRCRSAHRAFRMIITTGKANSDYWGYTESDIGSEFAINYGDLQFPSAQVDAVYLYVHRSVLKALLNGVGMLMHNHHPIRDSNGRILCEIRLPKGHRKALFVVKQEGAVTSDAAVRIGESIAAGKQAGLFPQLASWGALWMGCENGAVYGVSANLAFNLGFDFPVLSQHEIALVLPYETS